MKVIKNRPMDDIETLNRRARLRELIESCFNGKTAELIRHITATTGKTPNQGELSLIQKDNSGKSFGDKKAKGLTEQIGLHRRWFDFPVGTNTAREDWDKEYPSHAGNSLTPPRPILTFSNADELVAGEYVHLPNIEINLSAGEGQAMWHVDTKGKARAFDARWAARKGIKPNCAATMVVAGNSMNDRLQDGDSVVVDYCRKQILDGKVYAFVWQDEYFIKRLFKEPGGGVRIVSDNQDKVRYPDRHADKEHLGEIEIIGMVIAIAGGDV